MLYLDGNIEEVYLSGHWHQEAYLGSVLVWRGYELAAAQCDIVAALVESAHGVQALILPAEAAAAFAVAMQATGLPSGAQDASGAAGLDIQSDAAGGPAGAENASGGQSLSLLYTMPAKPVTLADADADANAMHLQTSVPDGESIAAQQARGGQALKMEMPESIPGVVAILENSNVNASDLTQNTEAAGGAADSKNNTGEYTMSVGAQAAGDMGDGAGAKAGMREALATESSGSKLHVNVGTSGMSAGLQLSGNGQMLVLADDRGNASCMMNTSASAQAWQLPELYSNLLHTDWVYSAIQNIQNHGLEVT